MSLLRYERLPRDYPNRLLAASVNPSDWSQVEPYFTLLQGRPITSALDLEHWLDDYSELFTAISEEGTVRYIRMTEQTDNAEYREAYLSFIERVEPKVKVAQFNLNHKYAGSEYRNSLPKARYSLLDLRIANSVRLFREENVSLQADERGLAQKYQGIIGSMTVVFDGRERTLPEMQKYLEEPDRRLREGAWTLTQRRILRDREQLDGIYDRMVVLRQKIAENAGFTNYRDYAFLKRERFDYGPQDCLRFHEAVEQHIVPLLREMYARRKEALKLDTLRPWDVLADPLGRPPLRPFKTTDDLVSGCHRVFEQVSPELMRNFDRMVELGLLDLESRPGKAPGGYNTELSQLRLPFIFTNSVGRDDDLRTLLHESGHAFHVFEMKDKDLHYLYRGDSVPTEFAEVASMSMELIAGEHLEGIFYDKDSALRSGYDHFRMVAWLLGWIATIDAFQHWVYTHPGHTREERNDAWVSTFERFSTGESWEGFEEGRLTHWHRQLHLFEMPFYYIEYGIAQLGALGVWMRYRSDPKEAVAAYRRALALGESRPLPELFGVAGLPWDFGPGIVERYARELRRILI
jgi:oligoendopeptidase F